MAVPIPDEQAALLAAIVAEPDEDTPRLVYADWLQEHGDDEQAQFIRDSIQIEWLEDYEDDKREQMGKRLVSTEMQNGDAWLAALGLVELEPVYDRGLVVGAVYNDLESFWAESSLLFARAPVRELTIHMHATTSRESNGSFYEIWAMPEFLALRELRLTNSYARAFVSWEQFITSPCLMNLEALSLTEVGLSDEDTHAFNRCEHLGRLKELELSSNWLSVEGALTVVRSPNLSNLRRLGLAYNNIVEDRKRGSAYLALLAALHERFDGIDALGR